MDYSKTGLRTPEVAPAILPSCILSFPENVRWNGVPTNDSGCARLRSNTAVSSRPQPMATTKFKSLFHQTLVKILADSLGHPEAELTTSFFFFFLILAKLHSLQDLSSPTRD